MFSTGNPRKAVFKGILGGSIFDQFWPFLVFFSEILIIFVSFFSVKFRRNLLCFFTYFFDIFFSRLKKFNENWLKFSAEIAENHAFLSILVRHNNIFKKSMKKE